MGAIKSKSVFSTEKDRYISGVIFSKNGGILGYYTSSLGDVSQYNFSPVTITTTMGDRVETKKRN